MPAAALRLPVMHLQARMVVSHCHISMSFVWKTSIHAFLGSTRTHAHIETAELGHACLQTQCSDNVYSKFRGHAASRRPVNHGRCSKATRRSFKQGLSRIFASASNRIQLCLGFAAAAGGLGIATS